MSSAAIPIAADPFSVLTIGALSKATGVPVETLRTWERRYGFPAPIERIDSGHRRYPLDSVDRLRLAVRALELGHKPSVVLRASVETLRELLSLASADAAPASRVDVPADGTFTERCLAFVQRLDGEALVQELERAWNEAGALDFLTRRVGPLLDAVGEAWSRGDIEVGHEHFASEHVREFLASRWRPLSDRARGPRLVCATIGGELHVLGLHMAAIAVAQAGAQVIFLGAATPPDDVVRTATRQQARGVVLSAAEGADRVALARDVKAVLDALPSGVPIAVGGRGFDPPPPGVLAKSDLRDLADWARSL